MQAYRTILFITGIVVCATVTSAEARHPSYYVLRGPAANPQHGHQSHYPGYGYAVQPEAYSYGWFGAKPTKQWTRNFGYYRNFTEWSTR